VRLFRLCSPRETADTVFDIDFERLFRDGRRALLFDLDNTLRRRWGAELFPGVESLLARLGRSGFRVGILTNRRRIERDPLLEALAKEFPTAVHARKPRRGAFLSLLDRLGAAPAEAVMIGDRRLTDVLGANRLGIYTVRIAHPERTRLTSRHQ
jgi:HAD superfamily phosphatase (TIGR01668 family)